MNHKYYRVCDDDSDNVFACETLEEAKAKAESLFVHRSITDVRPIDIELVGTDRHGYYESRGSIGQWAVYGYKSLEE